MKIYCPKCKAELEYKSVNGKIYEIICNKCDFKPSEKEMQDIYDSVLIDDDMKFWKEAQKYR